MQLIHNLQVFIKGLTLHAATEQLLQFVVHLCGLHPVPELGADTITSRWDGVLFLVRANVGPRLHPGHISLTSASQVAEGGREGGRKNYKSITYRNNPTSLRQHFRTYQFS